MKTTLIFVFLFIYAPGSVAEEIASASRQSEIHHQADQGNLEASGNLGLGAFTSKSSTGTTKITTVVLTPAIEYGALPFLSVGFSAPYAWSWVDYAPTAGTDSSAVSWADPSIYVKFRTDLPVGAIHGQLTYAKSLDYARSGKNYSGADSFVPALGYEILIDKKLFGVRIEYTIIQGKQKINENAMEHEVDYEVKGGDIFKSEIFCEFEEASKIYGISLSTYSRSKSTKTAVSNYAIDTSLAAGVPLTRQNSAPLTNVVLQGYFPKDAGPNAKLIPKIGYQWAQAFDKTSISSASGWQLELTGRLTF